MGRWELARRKVQPFPRTAASELHATVLAASTKSSLFIKGSAGSGKTTLLIQRALALIESGIDPSRILVLTFSREHANYLRDTIAINANSVAREPLARTLSSLAFSIIRSALDEDVREPILVSGAEQDQLIRSLLTSDEERANWSADLEKALPTRGFTKELRDLISRAKEWGLQWDSLETLGREVSDQNWISAARFWRKMEEVSIMRESNVGDPKERIDPSELINRAALFLEKSQRLQEGIRSHFDVILIDHFEESDPSHRRLIKALGSDVCAIFYDGASAVSRFRGADPEGLEPFFDSLPLDAIRVDLGASLRQEPELLVFEADSVADQARAISDYLRSRHLRDGIAFEEMAVIVRSPGEHLSAIRRTLTLSGVPVTQESGTQSLSESSAIKPLIMIAEIALGMTELREENFERIEELLLSEFGGLDPLRMKRLRERINKEREEGDLRSTNEVILSSLIDREVIISFDPEGELQPLTELLRSARKVASQRNCSATDLLWHIWSSARSHDGELISERWRLRALESHSLYEIGAADRDLDLITELFEVARRFVERFPLTSPKLFIEELKATKLFGDVIAPAGNIGDRVTLTTVHSAKGSSWRVVVVAGVQEGLWPNLKSRGSLLGSERLVEIQRYGRLAKAELAAMSATALVEDEARLFHYAMSRSSEYLAITALSKEDVLPSPYFYQMLERASATESAIDPSPLSLIPMIATLRARSMDQAIPLSERERAAALLKALSREGHHAAAPSHWLGFHRASTEEPLVRDGDVIRVSPSEVDRFIECQLRWFLEKSGARDGDSQAALLGSALHAYAQLIAENQVGIEEARSRLERTWHLIDSSPGWSHRHELRRAIRILDRFFLWHSANERRVIAAEAELDLTLGRVRLRGTADRIEIDDEGKLYVVDLKTTASAISKEKAEENLQLASYQSALAQGGFQGISDLLPEEITLGGAELVYPGTDAQSITTRTQRPKDPSEITATIAEQAVLMAGNRFVAKINSNCRHCAVRTLCPMQGSGKSVVQQ